MLSCSHLLAVSGQPRLRLSIARNPLRHLGFIPSTMPQRKRSRRPSDVRHVILTGSSSQADAQPQKKRTRRTATDSEKLLTAAKASTSHLKVDTVDSDTAGVPTRCIGSWKFGPHVSAAGGVENAVLNAAKIGYVANLILGRWIMPAPPVEPHLAQYRATAFALFVKSQRKWESKGMSEESVQRFKARMKTLGYDRKHVLPHGNYLVNLGNPDA